MEKMGSGTHLQVLGILRDSATPMSAYDLLNVFRNENPRAAPTTIYRALSALKVSGHVHRLESLNAYVACQHSEHSGVSVMSICDDCGRVDEAPAPEVFSAISGLTSRSGFDARRHVVELIGQCATCSDQGASA